MTDDPTLDNFSIDVGEFDRETWVEVVEEALERVAKSESQSERVVLRQEIANIYEQQLDAPAEAFAILLLAFIENPMNKTTIENLERLADALDKWGDLYASSAAALSAAPGKHAHVELCLKFGDWCAQKLGQLDYAFGFYRQALEIKPDHMPAYLRIGRLYRHSEQWADLVAVLEVAASHCDDRERAKEFLFERGVIFEEHLNDVDAACKAYEQSLVMDPKYLPALDAMDRIMLARDEWWELISILRRKLEATEEDGDKIQIYMRIGEVLDRDAGDSEGAADNFKMALKIEPSNLEALEALQAIYEKIGKKVKVVDTLEKRIEFAGDDSAKVDLMESLAVMLEEEFADWERAASVWEQVLKVNPSHDRALTGLEMIYNRREKWPELAKLMLERLSQADNEDEKVELNLELGKIYGKHLGDWDNARASFEQVLKMDPKNHRALDGMAGVEVAREQWSEAAQTLEKLLELVRNSEQEKEVLHRLGTIFADKQEDNVSACKYFREVLAIDKNHVPAMKALRNAYIKMENWTEAAELLEYEQSITESRTGKAKRCFELGNLYYEMDNPALQKSWYEKAMEHDPYNQPAALALVDIYQEEGRHDDAESLLEMLIRLGVDRADEEKHNLYHKMSVTKNALGKTSEHLEAARKATEFGSSVTDYDSLSDLVHAAIKNEKYHEVVDTCRLISTKYKKELTPTQLTDLFYSLGLAYFKLSDRAKARRYLKQALEIDDSHRGSLEIIIELAIRKKNYSDVIVYKNQLATVLEGKERFDAYVELGDLCQQKIKNDDEAIKAFEYAIAEKPKNRPTLHKLLALYQLREQWTKVIETILIISETEADLNRLARLHYSMGVVWRDKLRDPQKALECFNASLDSNPDDEEVFKSFTSLIAQNKDWHQLEHNYKIMLHRLEGRNQKKFEADLQNSLGELYLYRLNDYPAAVQAFSAAIDLDTENIDYHDRLASAYFRMDDQQEAAIVKYRYLISHKPDTPKYYRRLGSALSSLGRHDEAWCVSSALAFLGEANEQEMEFYKRYLPASYPPAKSQMPDSLWQNALSHRGDSEIIAEIFSIVWPPILERAEQPLKAFGFSAKDRASRGNYEDLAKILSYISGTLGIHCVPELYVKQDDTSNFTPILTKTSSSFCGDRFLQGRSHEDILYMLTKHLVYYRPGRSIRWILPTTAELKAILSAATQLGGNACKQSGTKTKTILHYVGVLEELMTQKQLKKLSDVVSSLKVSDESLSVQEWIEGLEFTACRAALLLTGDLTKTVAMVRSERILATRPSLKSKVLDLQLFSISEQYAALRKALGISVNISDKG